MPDETADVDVPTSPRRLSVRVGLAFVQTLRPLLYVLLAASAVLTFLAGEPGRLPQWWAGAAPVLFGIFLVVFAVYRLKLVAAKRYPALLGFFQIGLMALVWVLLLPGQRQKMAALPEGDDDVLTLLRSSDARVRAVAAEAAGARGDARRYAPALIPLLDDGAPRVRQAASGALVKLGGGVDVAAGKEGGAAGEAWREEARRRAWLPQ